MLASTRVYLADPSSWLSLGFDISREAKGRFLLVPQTAGIIGALGTLLVARGTRLGALNQSVHEYRLKTYPSLVNTAAPLAVYFPEHGASVSLDPQRCREMGCAMSRWYFRHGGLFLSPHSRDAYFDLARALTRASLIERLSTPTFPQDAEALSIARVDRYRSELEQRFDLDDVDGWAFGPPAGAGSPAERFKDYIFLQRLSSRLRTELSKDLRSRRRAH